MRIIFFGTPHFAVPSLEALLAAGHDIALVVTQPDRPHPRHHTQTVPPPVKSCALAAGIPVVQPERPRGEEFLCQLRAANADLGVVVAYGHLLRPELLAIPRLGLVNVHASLLPRWRGAAPIHWALLSGDRESGVTIMRLEQGLDSGATWHTRHTPILPTDTTGALFERLSHIGAEALVETLPRIAGGEQPVPQGDQGVTLAPKIDRDTARIRWDESAEAVSRRIRAMDPAPGAWTTLDRHEIKLFGATPRPRAAGGGPSGDAVPGTLTIADHTLLVACSDASLAIHEIQPAGKRRMTAHDWINGGGVTAGMRFT